MRQRNVKVAIEKRKKKRLKNENKGLRLTVCLWKSWSMPSPKRETRGANLEGLSVSHSLASFLMSRINSHYLSAEEKEKVTWKTRAGRPSALHLSFFSTGSLSSSPLLTCSPSPRQRKSWQSLTVILLYSRLVKVLSIPLLISTVYGLSLVLWICLTVTFNGFMCLHLETSERLFCVSACASVWHIMMTDSASPDLLLAQLVVEISHWYRTDFSSVK